MLPGYHLGSIQGLGFSDNTDSLFWIVEVVQVDADHAVPLFCILISHNSFFVSIRGTYFRQTFLTLSHLGKKMSINVWDTFLLRWLLIFLELLHFLSERIPGTISLKYVLFRGLIN